MRDNYRVDNVSFDRLTPLHPFWFNDFPRLARDRAMDSGHASHAHVWIHVHMYTCPHIDVGTDTFTRSATHPPGRSLILLRIFGWIEAKGEEWFLFLALPLVPFRSRSFYEQSVRLCFFWNRLFSCVSQTDFALWQTGTSDFRQTRSDSLYVPPPAVSHPKRLSLISTISTCYYSPRLKYKNEHTDKLFVDSKEIRISRIYFS